MSPTGDDGLQQEILNPILTRRRLLESAAALGLTLSASGFLAACAGDDDESTAIGPTGDPQRGGRLRVGHVGGGKGESFNPATGSSFIDASRFFNIYDPLFAGQPDLEVEPGLALEWEPNDDSTMWVFKLRPDVVWHDGKPFTADDVIYTLQQMGDKDHIAHASVSNIKLADAQ